MKKLILSLVLVGGLAMLPTVAAASTFTMDLTQLLELYMVGQDPAHPGTFLAPVSRVNGGAKFTGSIGAGVPGNPHNGWAEMSVGANFLGQPYGGSPGQKPSNVQLGMGSLSGHDKYALAFDNRDENDWMFNLYFSANGLPSNGGAGTTYYIESAWTTVASLSSKVLVLDFSSCHVWGGGYNGELLNLANISVNLADITDIGFNIGATVPINGDDWTFEVIVRPIPEPTSMLLLGIGLIGLAGGRIRKRFIA